MKVSDPPLPPPDFCEILFGTCAGTYLSANYNTFEKCAATYFASIKPGCQSYHVCLAVTTKELAIHCPHAQGAAPCN
jgi:hypothetical protein